MWAELGVTMTDPVAVPWRFIPGETGVPRQWIEQLVLRTLQAGGPRGVPTTCPDDPEALCVVQVATAGHVGARACYRPTGVVRSENAGACGQTRALNQWRGERAMVELKGKGDTEVKPVYPDQERRKADAADGRMPRSPRGGWTQAAAILCAFACMAVNTTGLLAQSARAHDPNKAEVLTLLLRPEGFSAPAVKVDAGVYWVDVVNRSTVRNVNVEIDRLPGSDMAATVATHAVAGQEDLNLSRFTKALQLTPGTYRVSIAGHPKWVCSITVK
jgi:hypothetical protein